MIGANDVVNPDASNGPGLDLGIPILDADKAKQVVVAAQDQIATRFAGIDDPLFIVPKVAVLFGDRRGSLLKLDSPTSRRCEPRPRPTLHRPDVELAVPPEVAVEAVRDAFVAHYRGEWTMPPKVYVTNYPAGDFRAMPALGGGYALLKWVTSFPGNPARGLPTVSGLVLLSDAETRASCEAVLDAGAVTALRTGAAAVLAAETLGRADAEDRGGRSAPA